MNLPKFQDKRAKIKEPRLREKLKIFFSLAFLFSLFSLIFALPASAADTPPSASYTISPPQSEIEANPGQTVSFTIKAISDQQAPLILQLKIYDFYVADENGTPVLITDQLRSLTAKEFQKYALSSWVYPEIRQVVLQARETKPIQIAIAVPADAAPGGHYAAIVLENSAGQYLGTGARIESGLGSATQLVSLVSLKVKGNINEDILLKRFETSKQLYEFGPVDITTEIKNLSDIHINLKGEIVIKNMFGQVKDRLPLRDVNIFPSASKTYTNRWENTWGLGKYSAQLNATWGSGQVVRGLIYFWIIPVKLVMAVIIILVVLFLMGLSIKSHLRHRSMEEGFLLQQKEAEIKKLKKQLEEKK